MITLIAALSKNRVIGVDGRLPWKLPEDLKFFKETTAGHPIIMGRKTFESIGRPLPRRTNIVLSRDRKWSASGVLIAPHLTLAWELAQGAEGASEVFVIGGAQIYKEAMPSADRLLLTEVDLEISGDAFFPLWDATQFERQQSDSPRMDPESGIQYRFVTYLKRASSKA